MSLTGSVPKKVIVEHKMLPVSVPVLDRETHKKLLVSGKIDRYVRSTIILYKMLPVSVPVLDRETREKLPVSGKKFI